MEWTTPWIQLCQYKPLCIFALFCSFCFFTMKPLSTTLGHIIYKKWMTQGKADLWYLLCSCPLRHKLYSERFRPTLNPINRSFPCHVYIKYVFLFICGKSDLVCNFQYYLCSSILAELSALLNFEYKARNLLNNTLIILGKCCLQIKNFQGNTKSN